MPSTTSQTPPSAAPDRPASPPPDADVLGKALLSLVLLLTGSLLGVLSVVAGWAWAVRCLPEACTSATGLPVTELGVIALGVVGLACVLGSGLLTLRLWQGDDDRHPEG